MVLAGDPRPEDTNRGDRDVPVLIVQRPKRQIRGARLVAAFERLERRGARLRRRVRSHQRLQVGDGPGAGDTKPRHRGFTAIGVAVTQCRGEFFDVGRSDQTASFPTRFFLPNAQARRMLKM